MTVAVPRRFNWRWLRSPLAIALLLSVLLHVYAWLMAHLIGLAIRNGWLPGWLRPVVEPVAALVAPPPPAESPSPAAPEPAWEEMPLQFVEVDPLTATAEPPPQTPYFSTANTLAANLDPPKVEPEQEKPRIDGQRENTLKTFETTQPSETPPPPAPKEVVQAPEPQPAAPAPPVPVPVPSAPPTPIPTPTPIEPQAAAPNPLVLKETPPPQPLPLSKPQEVQQTLREAAEPLEVPKKTTPGETEEIQLAKVNPAPEKAIVRDPVNPVVPLTPQPAENTSEPVKPRRLKTLADARAAKGAIVGELMRQDGGVQRQALQSSLNVKASPLGDYNYRMVLNVQKEWYRLLEDQHYALERQGQVVITFNLHSDGTVTSLNIKDSNVGETLSFLCEMAVMRPSPFGEWPTEIRRLIGGDTVPVTFTFNYY
ncbi:MAG: hypothetical protein KIT22_07855 [Verrucomicrobiae bacterium]|nr:hypothetical protein [Verrucomicrobiae bacterium]